MSVEKKFISVHNIDDYEVLTDNGWEDIVRSGKTIPYKIWTIKTAKRKLSCADNHILFTIDLEEKFAKDFKIKELVATCDGFEEIVDMQISDKSVEMYDLELQEGNRRYFTNGFLSHNTLWTCHFAVALTKLGYNVLYLSGEMSEELIGQRLDANFLDYEMGDLGMDLDKKSYFKRLKGCYEKVSGRLKIKEYSAGAANALIIQNLLSEYKLKDDFVPDVIIADYLQLFSSFRLPASAAQNPYLYNKYVAEELRGLGRENNCTIISPTQTNRSGASAGEETDMADTADSFGLPMTADWMGALIQNDELFNLNKYLLKVLKSRFNDNINKIYTVGVSRSNMRLYELPPDQHELPQHMKDMLASQAMGQKAEKDKEAMDDLTSVMKFGS